MKPVYPASTSEKEMQQSDAVPLRERRFPKKSSGQHARRFLKKHPIPTCHPDIRHRLTEIHRNRFKTGEVYLFSPTGNPSDPGSCLWGVVDAICGGRLKMEILSYGFSEYRLNCLLPEGYRFTRLATRDELRDFVYNIAFREGIRHGHHSGPDSAYENRA